MSKFSISLCMILLALAADVRSGSAETAVSQELEVSPDKIELQMLSTFDSFIEQIQAKVKPAIEPMSNVAKIVMGMPLVGNALKCVHQTFENLVSILIELVRSFIKIISNFRALGTKIGLCFKHAQQPEAPRPVKCIPGVAGETVMDSIEPVKTFVFDFVKIYFSVMNLPTTLSSCALKRR